MDLQKLEHRSVMKFLVKEGNGPKVIHERMLAVYGDSAPSEYQVKFWCKQFKWGRQSIEDDPRTGRPADATTPEVCQKVEDLVMQDRRIKVSQIAGELGVSEGSVITILHDHLVMSKVSSRWVPRMLSPLQKQTRVEFSKENLGLWQADKETFIHQIVTGDETWVHHWDPETKQESMQWKHKTSPPPKKFRTQPSAGKLMATVFWDCEGILLIDYMAHKTTITGEVYATQLAMLKDAIKEKRRGKLSRGVMLLHDNAPVHKSKKAIDALRECGFQELNHPPYSPDLAPSDYFLFRNLKKHLRGQRFGGDDDLKATVSAWFDSQPSDFYLAGIGSLPEKWSKCAELRGDYIEKQ